MTDRAETPSIADDIKWIRENTASNGPRCGKILRVCFRVEQLERDLAAERERNKELVAALREAIDCFLAGHGWAKHLERWSALAANKEGGT